MELTEEIRDALKTAVQKLGSQAEVSRHSGLHEVYVGRYLSGKNRTISDSSAAKLIHMLQSLNINIPIREPRNVIPNSPELRCFVQNAMIDAGIQYPALARASNMKPDTLRRLLKGELSTWFPGNLAALLTQLGQGFDTAPLTDSERELLHPAHADGGIPTRPCWVFTMAQAAEFKDIYVPVEPESTWGCEVIPITDGRDCIAFRVEGGSMEPKFYAGDIVICDKHAELVNSKPVVCKIEDEVVCKIYSRIGKTVLLQSVHPDGRNYEVKATDLDWCIRVIRFQRDE